MRKLSNVLLTNENGEILAVSRGKDLTTWTLPGGQVEYGEREDQAARREAYEETGLVVYNLREVYAAKSQDWLIKTYSANYMGQIRESEEGSVRWVTSDILTRGPYSDYYLSLFRNISCS